MVKLKHRVIAIILLIVMLSVGNAFANDELKRKERELEELNQELEALSQSIDDNKDLQNEVNRKINTLNNEIRGLEKEILQLDIDIKTTEIDILEREEALRIAELGIADKNELLNSRLRVMYKSGTIGYLEVLFGAEDFTDLLSRIDMLQKILVHDQNLILYLKEQRDIIEEQKIALELSKDNLVVLFKDKLQRQKDLHVALNNLSVYKKELEQDAVAMAEMEEKILAKADEVTELIKNYQVPEKYVGGEMMWPVPGWYAINSPFGMRLHPITKVMHMHTGVDINATFGVPVVAAQSGTVLYSNWLGEYGKAVIIDHGGGVTTLYAHNDDLLVTAGQRVTAGETIALAGSTGYSTGPHLHFEVRIDGQYVEPLDYITGN